MTVKSFVDTNILVYARDITEPEKQRSAQILLDALWAGRNGRLSTQILNEYFVTVTKKIHHHLSKEEAWEDVSLYKEWRPLPINMEVLDTAYHVQRQYGLSWWDALVVSAASQLKCEIIYSEDLSHTQLYLGIKVLNPFKSNGSKQDV